MCVFPRPKPSRLILFLALAGASAVAGCGGSTGTVTGSVTYQGRPLKGGTVMFTPAGGGTSPVAVIINEDGSYTAEKVPVGEATITVDTAFLRPPPGGGMGGSPKYEPPKEAQGSNYKPPSDLGANARRYVPIPAKYANPAASGLTYKVTSGSQKHDIPLD
jgi:hypothetical protein